MKTKSALGGMIILAFISGCALLASAGNIDPRTARWIGFVLVTFFIFLFMWSASGFFLILLCRAISKRSCVGVSLRRALFFSLAVVSGLYLQRFELLGWWNIALIVFLVIFIEIFFVSKEDEGAGCCD